MLPLNKAYLSRPLGVEWAGWRTDTLRLQRAGWQLAVNQDLYYQRYQLLIRNERMHLVGISTITNIEHARFDADYGRGLANVAVFRMQEVAYDLHVVDISGLHGGILPLNEFEEIDATPQYVTTTRSLYELGIFATKRSTEQVLVDKADMTVIEHLEAIKRLQSPKQQELRQRMLREPVTDSQTPRLHLVAQLVHIEEAA